MGFVKFILFSVLMFAVLMYAWKLPPDEPREYVWAVHAVSVLVFYAMGAIVWLITRIFVRTPALRMSTVFAFGFLALAFLGKAYLESLGLMQRVYRAPAAARATNDRPPKAVPAQTAKRGPGPTQQAAEPGCQRHEDRERNHVTITCR